MHGEPTRIGVMACRSVGARIVTAWSGQEALSPQLRICDRRIESVYRRGVGQQAGCFQIREYCASLFVSAGSQLIGGGRVIEKLLHLTAQLCVLYLSHSGADKLVGSVSRSRFCSQVLSPLVSCSSAAPLRSDNRSRHSEQKGNCCNYRE